MWIRWLSKTPSSRTRRESSKATQHHDQRLKHRIIRDILMEFDFISTGGGLRQGTSNLNMRNTSYGLSYALKMFLAAAALLYIALALSSSTIFDDANSLTVSLFLGFVLGIPAVFLCILGMLGFAARAPHSREPVDAHSLQPNSISGECPNCDAAIPLTSATCSCCDALFGKHSSWQVRERRRV